MKKENKFISLIKNNKLKVGFLFISIILLSMSIGFSALEQTLYIAGTGNIDLPEYSIFIDSVEVASNSNGGYQNSDPTYSGSEAALYSILPNPNSSIVYTITIRNGGRTSGILDYNFISLNNEQIKYKILGVNNGDVLVAGDTVKVKVILEYWDNVTSVTNSEVSMLINFEYLQYKSDYSNDCTLAWDGSSTSEPTIRNVYGVDYYQISNANELAWFTNTINNGTTNVNAILTKDICLNSKTPTQIGINSFDGIFDGQNRKIKDYYYSKNIELDDDYTDYIGLFRNNNGHIKNINLTINISDSFLYDASWQATNHIMKQYIGGLVSSNSGKISNSSVNGELTGNYSMVTTCAVARPESYNYIAGIAGLNSGIVTGCSNKTAFSINYNSESSRCNYRKSPYLYSGGIVGQNAGYISDSYNNASLTSTITSIGNNSHYYGKLGGVVGDVTAGAVKNVYNVGTITHSATTEEESSVVETTSGCVVANNAGTITNAYYLDTCTFTGNGTPTSSNNLANLSIEIGNYFVKDIYSLNNGYPILGWQ